MHPYFSLNDISLNVKKNASAAVCAFPHAHRRPFKWSANHLKISRLRQRMKWNGTRSVEICAVLILVDTN